MAIPLSFHRITKPYFRTCSTRQSRSQAPFCLYALRAISVRAEGTFGRLRCSFGGDRPSQTARLVLSRMLLTFRLDPSHMKAGIPTVTPINLAIYPPSLPAILYVICQRPMPSCSKAPWGLSVQSRVTCIETSAGNEPQCICCSDQGTCGTTCAGIQCAGALRTGTYTAGASDECTDGDRLCKSGTYPSHS